MDVPSTRVESKSHPSRETIDAIVSERARFQKFLTARTGSEAETEDLLQQSLLKALQHDAQLRRGEKAVPWFYRILRNAISDHYRQKSSEQRRTDRLWTEMRAAGEDFAAPPKDWNRVVCACFSGLLTGLNPRYAKLIRRIDLNGESKTAVSREMKIRGGTLDVALHRARSSLRRRLELFCGACSREMCLECFCAREKAQGLAPLRRHPANRRHSHRSRTSPTKRALLPATASNQLRLHAAPSGYGAFTHRFFSEV